MNEFKEKQFNIGELKGISKQNIEEHLKLYSGYVTNANNIREKLDAMYNATAGDVYHYHELHRRFSFEYNGMRNHEIYFSSLEGEATPINEESELHKAITKQWGDFNIWYGNFMQVAKTRGIGWAILSFDNETGELLTHWMDEQHLGYLNNTTPILMLDMWEHSFVADYQPSGKGQYIEDFFSNLNWRVVEERYEEAIKRNS